jgi:hypothetical protein
MIPFPNMIPSIEQIYYFVTKIKEINPECNFCLHLLVVPEINAYKDKINALVICTNVKVHYMISNSHYQSKNEQRQDLNWEETYRYINNC